MVTVIQGLYSHLVRNIHQYIDDPFAEIDR